MKQRETRRLCPYCQVDLRIEIKKEEEEDLLHCPKDHYSANLKSFDDRWNDFVKRIQDLSEPMDGLKLSDDLLADLRKLNLKKESINEEADRERNDREA